MASYKIAQQRARLLLEMRVMSFARYFLTAVYSKFYGACPKVLGCKNNKDRVNYVSLNNLSSANFEIASKGKGNINLGKNFIKRKDLPASTVTTDQIIDKSEQLEALATASPLSTFPCHSYRRKFGISSDKAI